MGLSVEGEVGMSTHPIVVDPAWEQALRRHFPDLDMRVAVSPTTERLEMTAVIDGQRYGVAFTASDIAVFGSDFEIVLIDSVNLTLAKRTT